MAAVVHLTKSCPRVSLHISVLIERHQTCNELGRASIQNICAMVVPAILHKKRTIKRT